MKDLSVLSGSGVDHLRRQAKKLRRAGELPYHKALDVVAQGRGFRNWRELMESAGGRLALDGRGRGGR